MPTNSKCHKKSKKPELRQNNESDELTALLGLIETPHESESDKEAKDGPVGVKPKQWPTGCAACSQLQAAEVEKLQKFSLRYQGERNFTFQPQQKLFSSIFTALVKHRLSNLTWADQAPPHTILRVFVCLRIMMRDTNYQQQFCDMSGVKVLSQYLQKATDSYLVYGDGPYIVDIVKEMTNIFQKLSTIVQQRESLVNCRVHRSLVLLLCANDVVVLHCTLHALISLAQSSEPRSLIAELNSIEVLLRILQDYDMLSKKLAANLLRLLCGDEKAREMIKVFDGLPLLLSLLHSDSVTLLWNVVWCLVQMSADPDTSTEIKFMGGLPLLLSLLHDRKFVSDRTAVNTTNGAASAAVKSPALLNEEEIWSNHFFTNMDDPNRPSSGKQAEELKEHQLSLKSAVCAALTELAVNDTNAQQVVQGNGIYLIGLLILPPESTVSEKYKKAYDTLQANAFRTLRFLFSKERNRRLFKRVFPPDMFELFIDIGHYNRDINVYRQLVKKINNLEEDNLDEILCGIKSTNQNKAPTSFIGEYAVLELLGSGGFGSVYKVKKRKSGQSFLAMKEINALMPEMGKNAKERNKSIGDLISELNIIREQLRHPNIVRYYKTFEEKSKLYIVMELIEGAPLTEHFNSLKEKRERFSEERIWTIFIQIVLALRYLHKEKNIVHRDLTPNNIMLGEGDKVTITDFGLSKHKQPDCSKMTSVVGTILYSCPEIVQHEPYGEKADIWALGCVLYQMCALQPPFYSNNMLSLVKSIVDAEYPPLTEGHYSEKVSSTIRRCLTVDPSDRPDVVQVASHIADIMMCHMDSIRKDNGKLDRKLEQERKRTQKHFNKVNQDMKNYHRMYMVSQERYDKLANLQSSGGAQSIKDESEVVEPDLVSNSKSRNISTTSTGTETESESTVEGGWGSDDDFACSSGSESRESSAGHDSRARLVLPRPPGGTPKSRRSKPPRNPSTTSPSDPYAQLSLDIPAAAKISRDSGIGSADPSPSTASTTNSPGTSSPPSAEADKVRPRPKSFSLIQRSSSMDNMIRRSSPGRQRPNSAGKATLTISKRKVNQLSDPILQMLHMVHKIIYICQLPPTLSPNSRRRMIERYKRALFAPQSNTMNLKDEISKLLRGSQELIDINFGPNEGLGLVRQVRGEQDAARAKGHSTNVLDTDVEEVGVTYEQMTAIIETVLVEGGYYDTSQSVRHSRTLSCVSSNASSPSSSTAEQIRNGCL